MIRPIIELPAALAGQIRNEAAAAHPGECCGLIQGLRDGDVFRATALHPARNRAAEADRFDIDPRDHLAGAKAARAHGQGIIGCYHSHPAGRAEPSARDLAGAGEENFLWLIAAGEEIAAFVYSCGGFLSADCTISSG
ncbi:MAG TPA: M67 family metallopeptidase [Rhizomicrobium sp.]|nr:M67 family metallopeptidase [Rhizomicrobium sp.]